MSEVALKKRSGAEAAAKRLMAKAAEFQEQLRRRAYEVYLRRAEPGWPEAADWLIAEQEMLARRPPCELIEDSKSFRLTAALPGVEAGNLQVTVLPAAVVLEAKAAGHKSVRGGTVHLDEIPRSPVFRHIPLPATVDTGGCHAALEGGILEITLPKAAQAPQARARKKTPRAKAKARARGADRG